MKTTEAGKPNFYRLPKKLNLGCVFDKRERYLNIDLHQMHKPDIVADVLHLHHLPSAHFTEIVAQDLLEHLPRTATKRALLHWASLLQMGGTLHLRVPNILGVAQLLNKPENSSIEHQERIIQNLFGTQAYTGDFHFTTFTEIILRAYLQQCGFKIDYIDVRDTWLLDVVARKIAKVHPRDIDDFSDLLELDVEAQKFVEICYETILNRTADGQGLTHYVIALNKHHITKEQLIASFISSSERIIEDKSSPMKKFLKRIFNPKTSQYD